MMVALVAIGLGYFTGDDHYAFVGLFFLFLLGTYIFTNQLQYESGMTTVTNYTYTNGSLTATSALETKVLSAYNDSYTRWFGVLLSVAAAFGMIMSLLNLWEKRKENT
jgi:hypothetical protein